MSALIGKLLFASLASGLLLAGPVFARHGADDGPEDLGDRGDVPEVSIPEDRGDTADSIADVYDKGDAAERATDMSDHGGERDVSDRDQRDDAADKLSENGGDSADKLEKDSPDDRTELSSNSGSSDDNAASSLESDDSTQASLEKSGAENNSGSNSGSSDSGGSGSSGDDDSGTSDDNSGSGKSGESEDSDVRYARAGGPGSFEMDSEGRERRSSEVLFLGSESQIEAVRRAGHEVVIGKPLGALGNSLVRIRINDGENVESALKGLRALVPDAWIDANYGYRASSGGASPQAGPRLMPKPPTRGRIGVIDTGADGALGGPGMGITRAFASTPYTVRSHGTTVVQIAASHGVEVDVADVFEPDSKGGAIASADAIARALDWMVARGTPVINISIEGPPNKVLDEVIQRALKAGAVVVAAAGNEGPSAAPAYPAAYPGVIAVTAVDRNGKIYRRANQGDYVAFAALGVKVPVLVGKSGSVVSGTSYAAPLVAAEAAHIHKALSPANALQAVDELKKQTVDKGPKGRDPIYGWGVVFPD